MKRLSILSFILLSFVSLGLAAGDITINSGASLTLDSGTISVSGNWTNNGTFVNTGGKVAFINASVDSEIKGNSSFYNLECIIPGKNLYFQAGSTQTILNDLNFAGASGSLLGLYSLTSGSQWYLSVPATEGVTYADIKDANASNAVIICSNSTDSGNNYRWLFSAGGQPTWLSPLMAHTGYTLDTTPMLWFQTPNRDGLSFVDAQMVIATNSSFTANVSTFAYTTNSNGWENMPAMSVTVSTYTFQSSLDSDTTYYAKVRFYDNYFWTDWSDPMTIYISSANWTDTLVARTTPIRAVHFTELKNHIVNLRNFRALGDGSWSTWNVGVGNPIKASHINELRTSLDDVLAVEEITGYTWTDPSVEANNTQIRAVHLQELRDKVEFK
jgi:hypothetical protein